MLFYVFIVNVRRTQLNFELFRDLTDSMKLSEYIRRLRVSYFQNFSYTAEIRKLNFPPNNIVFEMKFYICIAQTTF